VKNTLYKGDLLRKQRIQHILLVRGETCWMLDDQLHRHKKLELGWAHRTNITKNRQNGFVFSGFYFLKIIIALKTVPLIAFKRNEMNRLLLFGAILLMSFQTKVMEGIVTGVQDGDTIEVTVDGKVVVVRLNGIDCPEDGQDLVQRPNNLPHSIAWKRK